ncbi:unnamed protein product [Protopolystoma xenopodis]|uniref:Bromo domain-containing protein n=1 Tax=Protopolystoma xenopodis TaxID=117903 RepID=A0A3S5B1B4_9PLAT|nr:unnamed protein product [Protopolystoma xenopodis]
MYTYIAKNHFFTSSPSPPIQIDPPQTSLPSVTTANTAYGSSLINSGGKTNESILSRVGFQRNLTPTELAIVQHEAGQMQRQLRICLRRVVARLARDRRFLVFTRPVDSDEAPDYHEVISNPMDLGKVRDNVDLHNYTTVEPFVKVGIYIL